MGVDSTEYKPVRRGILNAPTEDEAAHPWHLVTVPEMKASFLWCAHLHGHSKDMPRIEDLLEHQEFLFAIQCISRFPFGEVGEH